MGYFNQSNPEVAGLEWYPVRRLPKPLTVGRAIGAQWVNIAAADETITQIDAVLQGTIINTPVMLDVYGAGSLPAESDIFGAMSDPAVDGASSAGWEQSSDQGVSFVTYQNAGSDGFPFVNKSISENYTPSDILALVTLDGTMLRYRPTGTQTEGHLLWQLGASPTWIDSADDSAGTDPTGDRIGWVEVVITAKAANGASPTIDGRIRVGDINYGSDDGPRRIKPSWGRYTFRFWWDPSTGLPWVTGDIAQFLSGGLNQFGVAVNGKAGTDYRIGSVGIVFKALPETRLSTAVGTASKADGWIPFTLKDPALGAAGPDTSWVKSSSGTFIIVFALTGHGGKASLSGLDETGLQGQSSAVTNIPFMEGIVVPMVGSSMVPTAPASSAPPTIYSDWMLSFILHNDGPAISPDTQAYVNVTAGEVTNAPDSQSIGNLSGDYGVVTAVVARTTATTGLVFTFDGITGTLPPAAVPNDGLFHLIRLRLDGTVPEAGSQVLSWATDGAAGGWFVALADTGDVTLDPSDGTVPFDAFPNNVETPNADFVVNVMTVPDALTSFTASATVSVSNPRPAGQTPPGGPTLVYFAALSWDVSIDGQFAYYEVQRADTDAESAYATIAFLTTISRAFFNDVEARRNVPQFYRVRQVRSNGATSDWST